jgi:hypothetical protein
MEGKTHGKDIMLLCKSWYDKEKYKTLKEALTAYYHKHYNNEDIVPDYGFINDVLLKPIMVYEFANTNPHMLMNYIFSNDIIIRSKENDGVTYDEGLYNRITSFLSNQVVKGMIDTTAYWKKDEKGNILFDHHYILAEPIIE